MEKSAQELIAILTHDNLSFEWEAVVIERHPSHKTSESKNDEQKQFEFEEEFFSRFNQHSSYAKALLFLGFSHNNISLSPSLQFFRQLTTLFVEKFRQNPETIGIDGAITILISEAELLQLIQAAPFITGDEYLTLPFLKNIWAKLLSELQSELKQFKGDAQKYIKSYHAENYIHLVGKVFFHLVEKKDDEEFPFAFLATYSHTQTSHLPLKNALQEYENDSKKLLDLLSTVYRVAEKSALIKDILDSGEIFHPISFNTEEAYQFLQDVPYFEMCGVLCRIPNWWKGKSSPFKVSIKVGPQNESLMGLDSILSFNPVITFNDEAISEKEVAKILSAVDGLALIKGKWVAVDQEKLKKVLELFQQAKRMEKNGDVSFKDVLQIELGKKNIFDQSQSQSQSQFLNQKENSEILDISHNDWLTAIFNKLKNPTIIKTIAPTKDFLATLRPYQQSGLSWLYFLSSLQLGGLLADDMGLGKTIQVLAFLDLLRSQKGKGKKSKASLLIVPTSLIANWESEIKRFSPKLNYYVIHQGMNPQSREILSHDSKEIKKYDLIITTYGLIHRYEEFTQHQWHYIILDEAQAIKNPGTKQTKAIKSLTGYNQIALTGTPIENRLSDLWSIYDFINPGLLGNRQEFTTYTNALQNKSQRSNQQQNSPEKSDWGRLRSVISPYILRRLKTDKTIISDLPDKIEMQSYAELSKKQILLYQDYLDKLEKKLSITEEGIQRKGLILSSLMKLKQICNHPDQYLGNQEYKSEESGKFKRLQEICEVIYAKREKVLIFTQFREIIPALDRFLSNIFAHPGLVLHGGTASKKRKELVDTFQSENTTYTPYFVLSLKAGGVGLNLTAANHVIHFDRWWNPAVENQASDRAFRIGQTKKVIVHKFITQGTLEEKINVMIEQKASLSKEVIQSNSESWITEMDDKEILSLLKLKL